MTNSLDALAAEVMAASPGPLQGGIARQWSQMGGSSERTAEQQGQDRAAGFLPQTDLGNAERWQLRHGHDFRHSPEIGWLAWDGRRWSRDNAETRLMDSVFDTVRAIQFEAAARRQLGQAWGARLAELGQQLKAGTIDDAQHAAGRAALGDDPDPVVKQSRGTITLASDKLAAWGRTSEGQARIKAMADLARSLCTVRLDELDANPWAFNLLNGTLKIVRKKDVGATWTCEPHRRDDLITMLAPVQYDPAAVCPVYDAFMNRVQPDPMVQNYLDAYAAYCMTGDTGEQKFLINHGPLGANGKSTWVDVLGDIWGDYALTVNIEVFMNTQRNSTNPSPDLAELPRKRLVITSEPERGKPFAEAMVKLVTGGEPIQARHLNLPFFRFRPEFKILLSQNHEPNVSSDSAIWRRIHIARWNVTIPEHERDPLMKAKMLAERSGILNRVLKGMIDWGAEGLPDVEAVRAATAAVRDVSDPLGRFLRMATAMDPGSRVEATLLYRTYQAWAMFEGETPWKQKGFGGAMRDKGFATIKSSAMFYPGLRLIRNEHAFVEEGAPGQAVRRATLGPRIDGQTDEWDDDHPSAGGRREEEPF